MKNFITLSILLISQTTFAADIKCPQDGIGSMKGDQPSISVKTPKGHLLVCGFKEESIYSEFDIYSENKGKFSKSLFRVGALEQYKIEPFEGGVKLTELISFRGKQVPFQTQSMNCNMGSECSISRAVCEPAQTPFKTDILERIIPYYTNGKNPDEKLISELSDLAISGLPQAVDVFKKNPGMKLDGSSAELFKSTQQRLKHPCFNYDLL